MCLINTNSRLSRVITGLSSSPMFIKLHHIYYCTVHCRLSLQNPLHYSIILEPGRVWKLLSHCTKQNNERLPVEGVDRPTFHNNALYKVIPIYKEPSHLVL